MMPARPTVVVAITGLLLASLAVLGGCSTAPAVEDRATFIAEANAARGWFERNVTGLSTQLDRSAGYAVFPGVGQWGLIFSGGQFGRGLVANANDQQIGWAALNTASFGLQAGGRGFKLLAVFQDEATFRKYQDGQLAGSTSAVAVAGEAARSGTAPFVNGVAIYHGDSTGLMAGVNLGLDIIRYEPLETYR